MGEIFCDVYVLCVSHLFAVDKFVANAWIVWVHDEIIVVEVPPEFAVERECWLEAAA